MPPHTAPPAETPTYDDTYFDSDSDVEIPAAKQKTVLSNDELLYDPTLDDKDDAWARSRLSRYTTHSTKKGKQACAPPPRSTDAILSCPLCLTELCYDCQRHVRHANQYRAMFVESCCIRFDKLLSYQAALEQLSPMTLAATSDGATLLDADTYHPVECLNCGTPVAVYDHEELYHFYNVIAS
ncbi:hypothetical protein H4R34_005188 [Dimargaris verticillata]|uniref:E2F-associated phospho protein-domain-containing protein n=1 Tax=Dimargaris verticillata TaxID=2761393 RepID=A0A9W8EAG9_9FUNG|nr:hypothetical protein H4R34_005188 [Dimargaris verticillata]